MMIFVFCVGKIVMQIWFWIEGFHQNFITQQVGNLSTALGLDIQTLKAYL